MSHNPRVISNHILDNQLEVYGDNTYQYNDDGYLQTKTTPDGTTTYSYGAMGELLEVVTPTQTISYLHNANNQRVAKLVDGTIIEKYLWANLTTLLAIYDKDNNLIQRFEYADQRMPVSMVSSGSKYYLHYDQVGSLRAVTNSSHTIVKEIVYDTFGNILSDSNPSVKVPFGFAGGLYDSDAKLTRFGYRDYDAYTGKWTAKDPIGFDGGDSNLYGYVLGDPVGFVDSMGLLTEDETRQSQLDAIAQNILNDECISNAVRSRLRSVVRQGKLNYILSSNEPRDRNGRPIAGWEISDRYRGYSRNGNLIYLTGLLWETGSLNYNQARETLIHEVLHKVMPGTKNHPPAFMDRLNDETMNSILCCF